MIDIHSHILPGADDGAVDLQTSLEMADIAIKSGVTAIVATSHSDAFFHNGRYRRDVYLNALHDFRKELEKVGNPLKIYSGMEIFADFDTPHFLADKQLLTINGTHYALVEFPFRGNRTDATNILLSLRDMGIIPVVAHPERYIFVQNSPSVLNVWHEMGCALQLNKSSLFGRFGRESEALALEMLARGFAHAIASDAHSCISRTTELKSAYDFVNDEFGADAAHILFTENPGRIVSGKPIHNTRPRRFN